MRVGIHLTNQHPVGEDLRAALQGQLRLLFAARTAGWQSVWVAHHHLTDQTAMLQPIPYLGRLITESEGMWLGTAVHLLALANPVAAAEEIASLDIMSGGRFIYGAGLGYRDVEYDAAGVQGSRVGRFETNLAVMRRLWAGEAVDADLPWCKLRGATIALRPTEGGGLPVWLAANSDAAVQRAARLGDTWLINPHAVRETVARQLSNFRTVRSEAGLPAVTELPLIREVVCRSTRQAADAVAQRHLGEKYATYADWGQDRVMPDSESFRMPFAELAAGRFLVGDPDDCIAELQAWADLGVTTVIFRMHWAGMAVEDARETLDMLSRHVLPAL